MIVYHGAVPNTLDKVAPAGSVDVLYSFALTKRTVWLPWWRRLFIDSGAFSVWKSGKTIDIAKYLEYIQAWEPYYDKTVFACLDVIGGPRDVECYEQSYKNYRWLRKRLPKEVVLIPVVHFGEPLELVDRYAEYTNYVGLGGSVGKSPAERLRTLDQVFHLYPDPDKLGFHGFGVTAPKVATAFPWKTIDSTRAFRWAVNGLIETPFHKSFRVGRSTDDRLRPEKKLGKAELKAILAKAEEYGIDWATVCDYDNGQDVRQYWNIRTIDETSTKAVGHYHGRSQTQYLGLRG